MEVRQEVRVVGRVMKRRGFSSNICFVDLVITSLNDDLISPTPLSCCLASPPLEDARKEGGNVGTARHCSLQVYEYAQDNVRPGDAVLVSGIFEASNDKAFETCSTSIWTKGLRVLHVTVLEGWDPQVQ